MMPHNNLCLISPSNFSCKLEWRLKTTRGHSHLSLNSFLVWQIIWLIGRLDRPRFAYFTMNFKSCLWMARNSFSSLVGPDQELAFRTSQMVLFSPVLIWPAMEQASCLSGLMSDKLRFLFLSNTVVNRLRQSFTPCSTAVLWCVW